MIALDKFCKRYELLINMIFVKLVLSVIFKHGIIYDRQRLIFPDFLKLSNTMSKHAIVIIYF